jgi:hypothetical protein
MQASRTVPAVQRLEGLPIIVVFALLLAILIYTAPQVLQAPLK